MKVDRVSLAEAEAGRRLSARVRPDSGDEFELWFVIPEPFGGDDLDATPFLVALLPWVLATGEALELDGPVSPQVLGRVDEVMRIYESFYAGMAPVEVRVSYTAVPAPGPDTSTSFFSRGVDSWYSVFAERVAPTDPPLTHLVYCRGLDPMYAESQERRAIEAVRSAAALAGLELLIPETNLREHTDTILDWNPWHGAGLSAIGLALRPKRSLTPSAYAFGEVMPAGSHFTLDHRFSSEVTRIEVHGEATRAEKVAGLATWPAAVAMIKVCFSSNIVGNCGDCPKCIHTMLELHIAGADPSAAFDRPLTPARVASVELHPAATGRYGDTLVGLRARPDDAALTDAFVLAMLRGQTAVIADTLGKHDGEAFQAAAEQTSAAAALLDAEAAAPPHCTIQQSLVGLVRAVDRRRGRHVYGFGWMPQDAELAGELGSFEAFRQEDSLAAWVDHTGRLAVEGAPTAADPGASAGERAHFLLAPVRWGGRARLKSVADRARLLARPPAAPGPAKYAGVPVPIGYLHPHGAYGRVPLYSALHPITGDQLLTNSPVEASDMGYGEAQLLGFLLDRAPVTGRVGVVNRPRVPWASRYGLSARA